MKKTHHSRQLEGILCVDKPQDWTSFDVVAKMRGIADCHKIGHGGTLDPMATGVLPLFFGRSAKAMELMPNQDKRYTAAIRFGITTDTQDCTGNVLSTSEKPVTREALEAMRENNVIWVPTLSTIGNLRGKGRFNEQSVEKILKSAMDNVALFASMGGFLAPGTDAGAWAVPHGSLTEYALMKQCLGERSEAILDRGTRELEARF